MSERITAEARLESVDSTMDAARALAAGQDFLLVSAREQTRGKGTRGRSWLSSPGNIYMTIGVHRRHLPARRLSLFPLELGLHVWEACAAAAEGDARSALRLKWPNDLLVGGRKAGGILVESHGDMMLAGLGLNLVGAPSIADGGTPSASLAEAGLGPETREALIEDIYRRVREAPSGADYDAGSLLLDWQAKVDWNAEHRLRDRPGTPRVKPVSIDSLGRLLVRHADGSEERLISDYLA